jgi:hypothetical protein
MKKNAVALLFACAVLSLSACGQVETQELVETTAVDEEAQEETSAQKETETNEAALETVEAAETETEEASESNESVEMTPEEIANISHNYKWGIMEYEGEDSFVMEVKTSGSPIAAGSTIDFTALNSIFDYKPFTQITCGELVIDKESNPDWATDGSTDGIFGFIGENFSLSTDEEDAKKGEPLTVAFSYTGGDGSLHEFSITWMLDGTAEVSEGAITEE